MRKAMWNWYEGMDMLQFKRFLMTGKAFLMLALGSMLFFIMLGIAGMVQQQSSSSSIHSMKGITAAVSSGFFGEMLGMEMPRFESGLDSGTITGQEISALLMRALTNINPNNPSSFLASELPGMYTNDAFLLRRGSGTHNDIGPRDHLPLPDDADVEEPAVTPAGSDGNDGGSNGSAGGTDEDKPDPTTPVERPGSAKSKAVFVYHTHNRESWFPELGDDAKSPDSKTRNITLVGKRLAERLEEEGVGAMHSDADYPTSVQGYRYELSYKYTMKTVKEAMASSGDIKFLFDIHRDSQKRKYTTVDIDGKSYAQVYFIIGHRNPNWKENEAFATQIHDRLEKKYPGISRGIWGKSAATGNAEYNQSLSPGSVLIEIGGIENTLEESYRTADALAEIIASIYWEDEEV